MPTKLGYENRTTHTSLRAEGEVIATRDLA